jgi:hypothetical protein
MGMTAEQRILLKQALASVSQIEPISKPKSKGLPVISPPCSFLGERIPGQPCGSQLYRCNLFNEVTTRFIKCDKATRHCATCTSATKSTHPLIVEAAKVAAFPPEYPVDKYTGKGIVVVGGGKYWPSAYVTVKMIRHVGCQLPIQFWYIGEKEYDSKYAAKMIEGVGNIEIVDALTHPMANTARNLTGFPGSPPFQVKSFAALHSPFEEVLVLDADSYPCDDPTKLFSCPQYQKTGGIFWPDLPGTNQWTRWADWGVEKFGPDCGWEVGQYLLSKPTAWRQLNLARWYDDHGDWCYGARKHHDHGDKGPHRVAWAVYRATPTFYSTRSIWHNVAFIQPGPDKRTPMFIHRTRSKFTINFGRFSSTTQNGINIRAGLPLEREAFRYLEELAKAVRCV